MKKIYSFAVAALCAMSMSAQDVTKYVKVEVAPEDWCGEYLIVYEADDINNVANVFNGSLTDLDTKGNFFSANNPKQVINGTEVRAIDSSAEVDAATFIVTKSDKTEGCYFIQSKSGMWIGYNSTDPDPTSGEIEPNLKASNEKQYDNMIAMEDGKTSIVVTAKNGFELRFNNDDGKQRFRYHASGKKKAIKFYAKTTINEATGITTVAATSTSAALHDLMGRKVSAPQQGMIYILNGKKVRF